MNLSFTRDSAQRFVPVRLEHFGDGFRDRLTDQCFLRHALEPSQANRKLAWNLLYFRHPLLLPVVRVIEDPSRLWLLSPLPEACVAFNKRNLASLSGAELNRLPAQLISLSFHLRKLGLDPAWRLDRLLWQQDRLLCLLPIGRRDPAYGGDSAHEAHIVHALGAFLLHALNGFYLKPGAFHDPCQRIRRLRSQWSTILQRMVAADISERPRLETLMSESAKLIKQDFHESVASRVFHGFQQSMAEDWAQLRWQSKPVTFVEKFPGRERFSRLLPWIGARESEGDLVLHFWLQKPVASPFSLINQCQELLRGLFEEHGFHEAAVVCEPLAEWTEPIQVRDHLLFVLQQFGDSLGCNHFRRLWFVIEDFAHLDPSSGEVFQMILQAELPPWLGIVLTDNRGFHSDWCDILSLDGVHALPQGDSALLEACMPCVETVPNISDLRFSETFQIAAALDPRDAFTDLWCKLSPKQQLILKVGTILPGEASVGLLENAFNLGGLHQEFEWLHHLHCVCGSIDAFALAEPQLAQAMEKLLLEEERLKLYRALFNVLEGSDTHLLSRAFIADKLGKKKACGAAITQLERAVVHEGRFDLLHKLLEWRWLEAPEPLNQLVALAHGMAGFSDYKFGNDRWHMSQSLRAANKYRNRADFSRAIQSYRQIIGQRQLPVTLKAEAFAQMALCAQIGHVNLVTPELLRRFFRMTTFSDDLAPERYHEWVAILTSCQVDRPLRGQYRKAVDALPETMRAWVEGHAQLHSGEFAKAARAFRTASAWLSDHPNLRLQAYFKKSCGIVAYRQNQVDVARAHFKDVEQIYIELGDVEGIFNARFNLASAEFLAGDLVRAQSRFAWMLTQVEDNALLKCQIHYYLASCSQLRGLTDLFDKHATLHWNLAVRVKDREEQCKNLILKLWQPSLLDDLAFEQIASKLARLQAKENFLPLMIHEVQIALDFAALNLGVVRPPAEIEDNALTRWRCTLLNWLRGIDALSLKNLVAEVGDGYFAALHTLLLSEVMVAKNDSCDLPQAFFRDQAARFAAIYPERAFDLTQSGLDSMDAATACLLKSVNGIPRNGTYSEEQRQALRISLSQAWPFLAYGIATEQKGHWQIKAASGFAEPVQSALAITDMTHGNPLVSSCIHREESYPLVALPLEDKPCKRWMWFLGDQENDLVPSPSILKGFASLFRLAYPAEPTIATKHEKVTTPGFGMIGVSRSMQQVRERIAAFGPSSLNIYIWGASGTGKELTAKAFHDASARANKPFRAINCSHFSENLVASELFGHVRGAFTGAQASKAGLLELVDGGTLFLDEVGDLSPKIQSLLLRVIQEGEFTRVGDTQVRHVDIRFVSATNKSLHGLIDSGVFREDLFFRLVGEELHLPALKERFEDLPLLVDHFAKRFAKPGVKYHFTKDFYLRIRSYGWPGNVRELESYVQKMMVQWEGVREFNASHCPKFLRADAVTPPLMPSDTLTMEDWLTQQKFLIAQERLNQFGNNRTRAAESLGISRHSLAKIMESQLPKRGK
jgi:DNA-binding NtrC family response regulator/tetratricopeptide (TPR) repeat protein